MIFLRVNKLRLYSCFTVVAETHNFLMLDFSLVKNILISPELHLTSELQVFNAVVDWSSRDIEHRSKIARNIVLQVRLRLLLDQALTILLNKPSSICKTDEFKAIIQNVLRNKNESLKGNSCITSTSRYWNQNLFDIATCEIDSYRWDRAIFTLINGKELKRTKTFTLGIKINTVYQADELKCEIYIFREYMEDKNKEDKNIISDKKTFNHF